VCVCVLSNNILTELDNVVHVEDGLPEICRQRRFVPHAAHIKNTTPKYRENTGIILQDIKDIVRSVEYIASV
jgi:hypothetical protein